MKRLIKIRHRLASIICFYFSVFSVFAQIPTKTWRNHADYNTAQGLAVVGNKIYCHTTNALFYYDIDKRQTKAISKIDGLSENKISAIGNTADLLIVGYQSGQIDFIKDNKIIGFGIIAESQIIQGSKTINHILVDKNWIYLSCNFGVVVLNPETKAIKETYRYIGNNAQEIQAIETQVKNDSIYVKTKQNVLVASLLGNQNLQDFKNWKNSNLVFETINNSLLPKNNLIVSPQKYVKKDGFWWIADSKNGLLSDIDGGFKSYSPNGIIGNIKNISKNDNKIIAVGTETNVFDGTTWTKSIQKPNNNIITTQNGWTWEIISGQIKVSNPKTNQQRILSRFANEGNFQGSVLCLREDKNKRMWLGTDNGVSVLTISESIFTGNVNASSPFYERRRLLIQENVQAIAADGGNRKWIGTSNALYLFGDDGDELIEIFNTKNSPLLGNNILGLEVLKSGEVFILTENGLISYKSDASDANIEFKELLIYPNPVRSGFNGVLTISDLSDNTDVKITDLAGNLIYKTTSNGGIATWDLKFQGVRVASGIYLVLCTNEDGTEHLVGKFAVI